MTPYDEPAITAPRGGATVGLLTDLPPLEAAAVRFMRHWFSGPDSRMTVRSEMQHALGPVLGRQAFENTGRLCNFCAHAGRRPLVRHGLSCTCLGADESCFANLVAAAAQGQTDDANLLASLIVVPNQAVQAAILAAKAGMALEHMTTGHSVAAPTHEVAHNQMTARLH
ncbi:hypothetical protein [Phaeobacter sp.]|uniref:hypothetical protein n=1 Tax=Phaeobacter sp. TaxID=1902409 RepID=UPI0025F98F19|nr:hypothetical protein [Phaeobacter sp.]